MAIDYSADRWQAIANYYASPQTYDAGYTMADVASDYGGIVPDTVTADVKTGQAATGYVGGQLQSVSTTGQVYAAGAAPSYAGLGSDLGWEVSADGKKRRKKTADGRGGFVYGPWEDVVDETVTDKTSLNAIAAIKALLSSYGIGDLGDAIVNAVKKGYSSETIQLMMQDPNGTDELAKAYQTRFPANKARAAAGKAVLSASEYLNAEQSYSQILQSYGVSNMATRANFNKFIENDISATEVSDRVGLAINRVQNADAETKKMLAEYYPMLNQGDIVNAMLNPTEGLPSLQRKVQLAEVGGAALAQGLTTKIADATKNQLTGAQSGLETGYKGLTTGALGAEEVLAAGLTKEQARAAYGQVAEAAPRGTFLTSISKSGDVYTRLQAEQEAIQGLASAKRARQKLSEQEAARFGGSAGIARTGLTRGSKGSF